MSLQSLGDLLSGKSLSHGRVKVPPVGPSNARVMVVGDVPHSDDEKQLTPFVGEAGLEITKMLHEAGFIRNDCFLTHACPWRPPSSFPEKFFKS
jgi:uracil-DNA glycosylase family 4